MSKPAVFGIVDHEAQARSAVAALEAAGFGMADISVLSHDGNQSGVIQNDLLEADAISTRTGQIDPMTDASMPLPMTSAQPTTAYGTSDFGFGDVDAKTREVGHTNTTKAPEGATAGGISGGLIGGLAGWLIGIGALAIPGVGPLIAAGPILAALSGAAIGAAAGGITGGLIGFGIPEYEANLYAGKLKAGGILIGVHTVDSREAKLAREALESVDAHDIKVTSEVFAS